MFLLKILVSRPARPTKGLEAVLAFMKGLPCSDDGVQRPPRLVEARERIHRHRTYLEYRALLAGAVLDRRAAIGEALG